MRSRKPIKGNSNKRDISGSVKEFMDKLYLYAEKSAWVYGVVGKDFLGDEAALDRAIRSISICF